MNIKTMKRILKENGDYFFNEEEKILKNMHFNYLEQSKIKRTLCEQRDRLKKIISEREEKNDAYITFQMMDILSTMIAILTVEFDEKEHNDKNTSICLELLFLHMFRDKIAKTGVK